VTQYSLKAKWITAILDISQCKAVPKKMGGGIFNVNLFFLLQTPKDKLNPSS